jgi:hypothetical protein
VIFRFAFSSAALSDFFFFLIPFCEVWKYLVSCPFFAPSVRPSSVICPCLTPSFQLRKLCAPSTLFLLPLPRPRHPIHGHLCTASTRRSPTDTAHVTDRQPYRPAPQIRARKDRIRRPTCRPNPNPRHPLSATDPLLRAPLPLRVHFQEPS